MTPAELAEEVSHPSSPATRNERDAAAIFTRAVTTTPNLHRVVVPRAIVEELLGYYRRVHLGAMGTNLRPTVH